MGDLKVRRKLAIHKKRRAEASAQRDDHLETLTLNCPVALHIGIIDHSHRFSEPLLKGGSEIEAFQHVCAQVGCGDDLAVAHDPGKTDRDVIKPGQRVYVLDKSI